MSLEPAIEAACEAYLGWLGKRHLVDDAMEEILTLAMEAAAPYLLHEEIPYWRARAEQAEAWVKELEVRVIQNRDRAERAEAGVEYYKKVNAISCDERDEQFQRAEALADRLADALEREGHVSGDPTIAGEALAAWKEAREANP